MICPECQNGKVFHPLAHVRASRNFGKFTSCPRCDGSGVAYCCDGEDASRDSVTLYGDQASTLEDKSMVA